MSYFSLSSSILRDETLVVSSTPNIEGENKTSDCDLHRNDPTHSFLNEKENDEVSHVGQIPISQQLSSEDRKRKVSDSYDDDTTDYGLLPRRKYSHRNLGRVSALMCGVWGGSCMIPMHYSSDNTHGLGYVISFATGAIIVTILLWIPRFGYSVLVMRSIFAAYMSLPSFHLRVMWLPGTTELYGALGMSDRWWHANVVAKQLVTQHHKLHYLLVYCGVYFTTRKLQTLL